MFRPKGFSVLIVCLLFSTAGTAARAESLGQDGVDADGTARPFSGAVVSAAVEILDKPTATVPDPQAIAPGISRSFLRAAFTMRARRWPDGEALRVFVHKQDHSAHQLLCKTVLNMYPYQLRRSWDRLVYSGTGQAPIEVASESEMRSKVAETPGAIGYVLNAEGDGVVVIAH